MMSGKRRQETIQLSLGPTANAVTAHLLNLQGLSAITPVAASGDGGSPLVAVCDPNVTHRVDYSAGDPVWVPRVLFVDEAHRMQYSAAAAAKDPPHAIAATTPSFSATEIAKSTWNGNVQEFQMSSFSFDQYFNNAISAENNENIVANFSFNSNQHPPQTQAPEWLSSWQKTANQLAYAPFSNYRVSQSEFDQRSSYQQIDQQEQQQESRHVDWDNLGEEPDQDEEEQAALRERQRRAQMQRWTAERQQYEEELSNLWGTQQDHPSKLNTNDHQNNDKQQATCPSEVDLHNLSWIDYWMPPHPSPLSQCTFGLPSTSAASSLEAPPLYAFDISSNNYSSKNMLEELWEKVRLELERTDTCQGFSILTEGCGIYAGMTDWLLREMQQECRAAGRWVFHVASNDDGGDYEDLQDAAEVVNHENNLPGRKTTELAMAQARVRNRVQRGLALAGMTDKAHVLVPLRLPSLQKNQSLFRSSAELAMALETVTLPYRCRSSSSSSSPSPTLVGWNSTTGYEEGAAPSGMSLSDYLATLQPSPRFKLLELDSVVTPQNRTRLGQVLVAGTSVERDPRIRRPPSSLGAEYPGTWLMDEQFGRSDTSSSSSLSSGVLTSLSPGHVAQQDRSLHRHFGLSTCMRRTSSSDSPLLTTNEQYLTCLMEGMGIRYRPETAFGLVCNQGLTQLTNRGHQYGAGSYWQYLYGAGVEVPVLSVLGNTTRMHPYLHSIAADLKDALKSSKNTGYYQREVSNGTLPEVDDCEEAMENCLDLRDVYEPPAGSGFDTGDHEHYFDG